VLTGLRSARPPAHTHSEFVRGQASWVPSIPPTACHTPSNVSVCLIPHATSHETPRIWISKCSQIPNPDGRHDLSCGRAEVSNTRSPASPPASGQVSPLSYSGKSSFRPAGRAVEIQIRSLAACGGQYPFALPLWTLFFDRRIRYMRFFTGAGIYRRGTPSSLGRSPRWYRMAQYRRCLGGYRVLELKREYTTYRETVPSHPMPTSAVVAVNTYARALSNNNLFPGLVYTRF
jgi:hypothetical protein